MVMLYSSSMNMEMNKAAVGANYLISQLAWFAFGSIACVLAACLDYRKLKRPAPWFLGLAVVLLVLVFAPKIGITRNGAHRWIGLPRLPHLQSSEVAKLALIIFLAAYAERNHRRMREFVRGLLIPGALIAVTLALIFIEPDRGCTILLAAVSGVMLVLAGVRLIFFAPPAFLAVGALVVSIMRDPLRMGRVMAWLHPEQSKEGAGYQAYQAMIALGSGGIDGLGLGNGRQKLGFVPEHHTDFILAIIGEELGLFATLAVVGLFIMLIVCGCCIARRASDTFGLLLGAGITFMIGLQAFINIGVVTSVLPNKGMPLPFISYGGSNLLLMLVAVGLLLSIARHASADATAEKLSSSSDLPNA